MFGPEQGPLADMPERGLVRSKESNPQPTLEVLGMATMQVLQSIVAQDKLNQFLLSQPSQPSHNRHRIF